MFFVEHPINSINELLYLLHFDSHLCIKVAKLVLTYSKTKFLCKQCKIFKISNKKSFVLRLNNKFFDSKNLNPLKFPISTSKYL